MLPRFARAELRVGGSPRAKFSWKIFILRGEWRRREIRPPKVCVFHLSVNQYCRENTLQNGSNFGSLPHPYTSISGWILPHVFLHYPKDPRNAFRWDLNILLNCGVPYPAVSCSARTHSSFLLWGAKVIAPLGKTREERGKGWGGPHIDFTGNLSKGRNLWARPCSLQRGSTTVERKLRQEKTDVCFSTDLSPLRF